MSIKALLKQQKVWLLVSIKLFSENILCCSENPIHAHLILYLQVWPLSTHPVSAVVVGASYIVSYLGNIYLLLSALCSMYSIKSFWSSKQHFKCTFNCTKFGCHYNSETQQFELKQPGVYLYVLNDVYLALLPNNAQNKDIFEWLCEMRFVK